MEYCLRTRILFLRGMGFIYLIAFSSFLFQAPGLFGEDGLEPVNTFLSAIVDKSPSTSLLSFFQARPTLIWFHDIIGLDVDTSLDGIALGGLLFSSFAALGFGNSAIMASCWLLYLSLYCIGQTFLSFQWDILLLEAGFATVLFSPLPGAWGRSPSPASLWALRFLLFKLMLMSGAVKLQANCPTWLELTALEYHYATQCIPTALAWYAHQLPPLLQRASVAATLVIELPATLLLIAPFRAPRILAAATQLLLQVLIVLTGNYNFFNLLTALLCLPLLDDRCLPRCCLPLSTLAAVGDDRGCKERRTTGVDGVDTPLPASGGDGLNGDGDGSEEDTTGEQRGPIGAASDCEGEEGDGEGAGVGGASDVETEEETAAADSQSAHCTGSGGNAVRSTAVASPRPSLLSWRELDQRGPLLWCVDVHAAVNGSAVAFNLSLAASSLALAACTYAMFSLSSACPADTSDAPWYDCTHLSLQLSIAQLNALLLAWLPATVALLWAGVAVACCHHVHRCTRQPQLPPAEAAAAPERGRRCWRSLCTVLRVCEAVAGAAAGLTLIILSAVPMSTLHPQLQSRLPVSSIHLYQAAAPWHLTGGYGLFRRMTGMGAGHVDPGSGFAVPVVARPEIILEASDDGAQWRELHFKHKPGDPLSPPTQVAPHQPRLDWQMWFAALGSYQSAPWVLHFAVKLLLGTPSALHLIHPTRNNHSFPTPPTAAAAGGVSAAAATPPPLSPPRFIRAWLYHYDYTRWNNTWNRRQPRPHLLPLPSFLARTASTPSSPHPPNGQGTQVKQVPWWTRARVKEYFPPLELGNDSLRHFLSAHGWGSTAAQMEMGVAAAAAKRRARQAERRGWETAHLGVSSGPKSKKGSGKRSSASKGSTKKKGKAARRRRAATKKKRQQLSQQEALAAGVCSSAVLCPLLFAVRAHCWEVIQSVWLLVAAVSLIQAAFIAVAAAASRRSLPLLPAAKKLKLD